MTREMPFEKVIIMMCGRKAIYGDKIHYYQESPFIDRLKALSPTLRQIKGIPSKDAMDNAIAAGELQIDIESVAQEIVTPLPTFASPLENVPSHVERPSRPSRNHRSRDS